jgi:hypothetical protein
LLPPTILYGTSFTDPVVVLRDHEAFKALYHTRGNQPWRMGPVLANLPPAVKFFVLEYPEYYLQRFAEFPIQAACHPASAAFASANSPKPLPDPVP